MQTIWKFPLEITDVQQISVPDNATPLHIGLDPVGNTCIWFQVDDQDPCVMCDVFVVGTGNPLPAGASHHIGSLVSGRFMWHVYL